MINVGFIFFNIALHTVGLLSEGRSRIGIPHAVVILQSPLELVYVKAEAPLPGHQSSAVRLGTLSTPPARLQSRTEMNQVERREEKQNWPISSESCASSDGADHHSQLLA